MSEKARTITRTKECLAMKGIPPFFTDWFIPILSYPQEEGMDHDE